MREIHDELEQAMVRLMRHLFNDIDFRQLHRKDWRASCMGHQRVKFQQYLCELGRCARQTVTTADTLLLYQAAYAILPLHGQPLVEFTELLLQVRPVPLEWCDVLIHALQEQPKLPPTFSRHITAAVRETMALPYTTDYDKALVNSLSRQLAGLLLSNDQNTPASHQ